MKSGKYRLAGYFTVSRFTTIAEKKMPRPILKDLMLGLIYPAVLGTVMYGGLQATIEPILVILTGGASTAHQDPHLYIKAALLAVTITFYLADYLYIVFTKTFGWLFFVFDVGFLITLYVTVSVIGLTVGSTRPPHYPTILGCFFVFMVLYFVWDTIEWWRSFETKEREWYPRMLIWELASMAGLWSAWYWGIPRKEAGLIIVLVLILITSAFWVLTLQKGRFIDVKQTN